MSNSKDRNYIRSAIQDELQAIVDLLPSLKTGEAIISGEGVKIPSKIQFFKLRDAIKGRDPLVTYGWSKPGRGSIEEYKKLLLIWRNQNLNKETNNE